GSPRLAGHGFRGDDDDLHVQRSGRSAVEARAAEHEQGLSPADPDRAHAGARTGADSRVRAGPQRAARGAGGGFGRRPRRRRSAGRSRRDEVAARRPRHRRHGPVDPRRAGSRARAVEADERRGRARVVVPRLRARARRPSEPPADDREPAQPGGVHAPSRSQRSIMTLSASRSFIARYPSGTSSRLATRSKTRPGSILPSRMSGRSSSMYARTGAGPALTGKLL